MQDLCTKMGSLTVCDKQRMLDVPGWYRDYCNCRACEGWLRNEKDVDEIVEVILNHSREIEFPTEVKVFFFN